MLNLHLSSRTTPPRPSSAPRRTLLCCVNLIAARCWDAQSSLFGSVREGFSTVWPVGQRYSLFSFSLERIERKRKKFISFGIYYVYLGVTRCRSSGPTHKAGPGSSSGDLHLERQKLAASLRPTLTQDGSATASPEVFF